MYVWPTCPMEVKNILINSKPKLSAGFDEIPLKLLKSSDNIIMALSHIFNLSLSTGKVISDFKIAKIIPLYKKGDASDINNYRPISLLSNISKILEKIMYRRVISFLNRHNFFFENQFGFRKKCSTSQAISLLINSITNSFNKNEKSLAIFLDLSKAFDTISIEILLKKLDHYGIRGLAYIWFKNYLLNRKQQVVCFGVLSSTINSSTMGFPQGSILGPLLFLIYVNDFNNCLTKSKAVMFADDTTVWTSHKNTSTLFQFMQSEMELIDRWLVFNKLSINIEKTKFMLFSTPNSNVGGKHSLSIRNRQIDQVNSLKFLGVFIHNNLSWSLHMKYLISKLRSCYGVVCKIKSLVNKDSLLLLYHSLINSHLQYCISNWCFGNSTLITKLQQICNKFLRMIFELPYCSNINDIMKQCNILKINQLYKLETASLMFKLIQGGNKSPAFSCNLHLNPCKYNTRNKAQYITHHCKTTVAKQSFSYQGPFIWNSLPANLKTSNQTFKCFRNNLKKFLLNESI